MARTGSSESSSVRAHRNPAISPVRWKPQPQETDDMPASQLQPFIQ